MKSKQSPIVLMYHGTTNNYPVSKYSIQASQFKKHLIYLRKNGWHTVCLSELCTPDDLPDKTVALTFDDGYADNFENAFLPLLENNMKATWFITTDGIGKHAEWMGPPSEQTKMLTASQLSEMSAAGMEIGSHTCSHPDLSQATFEQQARELSESKQLLEALLQKPVKGFAYPFGRYNEESLTAITATGYDWACSTRSGWFDKEPNPLLIRRVTIFADDTAAILARKLAFADNDVSWKKMANYYSQRLKAKFLH
ncbi:polysaccharide deacetylase family protein [Methylomicrobium sp. RS1]|uniref:polysaccharide deacetylase family protein n=1 Tax=Candidatus Methylomicrobium oryzae TaxID=2802053 RepID=UPI001921F415|nr:polysaccharide deacetylase family protein [Methylomicrobium sp. RS1]MBL1264989.1 polysaccharide deacetylase family protein [Methylomicrobium sp. RS1]